MFKLALAVLLVATSVTAAGLPAVLDNDAGSGRDAGGAPADALVLPGPGRYQGGLTPPSDADWYRLPIAGVTPACIDVSIQGAAIARTTLTSEGEPGYRTTHDLLSGTRLGLALALPTRMDVLLGIEPTTLSNGADISAGTYDFNLSVRGLDDIKLGDGGTAEDAGSTPATAAKIEDACVGGTLNASAGDEFDLYQFEGAQGQHYELSLADDPLAPAALSLLSPSGDVVANVTSGHVQPVVLNETGQWVVKLTPTTTGMTPYLFGMSGFRGPPEPPPCHPMCLATPPGR